MTNSTHGACLLSSAAILSIVAFAEALGASAHHVDVSALAQHAGPRPMAFVATIAALALSATPMLSLCVAALRRGRLSPAMVGVVVVGGVLVAGWTFVAVCASLIASSLLWLQQRKRVVVAPID